ncbi:MAG: hypothetical protein AB1730_06490 [Myxococcota bacterium]|jgi:hypothetical protein
MYDIGGIYSFQDFGFPEGPVTLFGVRVRERGAGLGRMALGAVFMLLGSASEAAASTVGEYRGSTYSQDLSGNVYRTDHYQRASPEELARMRESRDEGFDAIMSAPMSMDLQLFFGGANGASGISFEITPFTVGLLAKGRVGFEVAFAYTLLRDHAALGERERQYQNLGVPIRLMANFSWLQLALQWTPNIFGSFGGNAQKVVDDYRASVTSDPTTPITYRTSPLSLAVTLTPLKYIFIRATGTINRWDWSTRVLGYSLELGVRL